MENPCLSKAEWNHTKNASMLAYLTSEQALADFAVLSRELKKIYCVEASSVVLFGGSYGGLLAAWRWLKYPHVVIGALSYSAPLLYFEDILPPETFYDLVSRNFKVMCSKCVRLPNACKGDNLGGRYGFRTFR